ncbi:hypothetical protein CDL15_Pgr020992 [Punica granatum]|uniref:Uncharacterized protein n=1 Tax=Punica granatum TaxID=22663 RepID=A0A218Y061_PUNGR|nr:hypothetical protein CDL15_Pgr020992 [Punica granatum]
MVVIRIPAKRCYRDGVKEPEAVQGPERKKQKRVDVMGLRASSSLKKQRPEAAIDNLKQKRVDVVGLKASSSLEKRGTEAAMDNLK